MANYLSEMELPNGNTYELKDKNKNVFFGTCETAAATAAKVITLSNGDSFELKPGAFIGVKFTYSNTASNVTFNVNNTGAKSIWYSNAVYTSNSNSVTGYANRTYFYMYDGTYWVVVNKGFDDSNTYPSAYCSTAAGTAAKAASCTGYALLAKSYLHIVMTQSNTAASALTLNVNSKGAKPIYINGTASSSSNHTLPAGSYLIYYDGTNYYFRTDGKITGNITGDAETVNGHTINIDVPANAKFTDNNTTYAVVSTAANGLAPKVTSTSGFLMGDGTWANPLVYASAFTALIHNGSTAASSTITYYPSNGTTGSKQFDAAGTNAITNITRSGVTFTATRANGSTFTFTQQDNNTTYASLKNPNAITIKTYNGESTPTETTYDGSSTKSISVAGTNAITGFIQSTASNYLQVQRADGTESGGFIHFPNASTLAAGALKQLDGDTSHYLRGDGTWATPPNTTYASLKNPNALTVNVYSGTSTPTETTYDGSSTKSAAVASASAITSISRSGTTFTATRANGGTFTFTQQDNNTTYAVASSIADGLMSTTSYLRTAELALNVIPLNWASTFSHTAYEQNGLYCYGQIGIVLLNFTSTVDHASEMTIGTFNGSYAAPYYTTSINVQPNTESTISAPYIKIKSDKSVVLGGYRGNIHKGIRAIFSVPIITKFGAT